MFSIFVVLYMRRWFYMILILLTLSLLIMSFIVYMFLNGVPFLPDNYSILSFLVTIFNLLFWSSIIFWIYKWKIDRHNVLQDRFNEKALWLIDLINKFWYSQHSYIDLIKINSFKKIVFSHGKLAISILSNHIIDKDLIDTAKKYAIVFEFIHLIVLNKKYLWKNSEFFLLQTQMIWNLVFYYYFFLIGYIVSNMDYRIDSKNQVLILQNQSDIVVIEGLIKKLYTFYEICNSQKQKYF
jgi:hypothetical protein